MSDTISAEEIFDAVVRIQVLEKRSLEVDFFPGRVRVHLPPKRVLVRSCSVPVLKMTAVLSGMEKDQLIGTEQRGGMWTTPPGNRIIAGYLAGKYRGEAEALLGTEVLNTLLTRLTASFPET